MERYTIDELLVCAMSREISGDDVVVIGVATPLASVAAMLARETHAPYSSTIYAGTVAPVLHDVALSTVYPDRLADMAQGFVRHGEVLDQIQRGKVSLQFLSPAQIDRHGNANTSLIGDHVRPKVRFPGGLATADCLLLIGRIVYYQTSHSARMFVERVDFVTGAGHLEEGKWRKRMRIPGKGPVRVITNLAVMGFREETGEMILESVHPGVTVAQVQENTGFPLARAAKVGITEPPTAEELHILREQLDPRGIRKLEFREHRSEIIAKLATVKTELASRS